MEIGLRPGFLKIAVILGLALAAYALWLARMWVWTLGVFCADLAMIAFFWACVLFVPYLVVGCMHAVCVNVVFTGLSPVPWSKYSRLYGAALMSLTVVEAPAHLWMRHRLAPIVAKFEAIPRCEMSRCHEEVMDERDQVLRSCGFTQLLPWGVNAGWFTETDFTTDVPYVYTVRFLSLR